MKRAMLVTFEIKTRVIVDTDDNATNANLDWEVANVAADKIKTNPDGYLNAENMTDVSTDFESPYDPDYDKVDLHIPSSMEMIDFLKRTRTNEAINKHQIWLKKSVDLANDISIESVWVDDSNNRFKVDYNCPRLESIGISWVDWNDIATEVKLKILKAIDYHED